ncbi:MAG TPA: tyrosine-type recombinase/integrase [Actinomycetes bacterium]|nr:tyrosine-type recombinase/integrase [Actinomycetes bacterium]
MTIRRRRDGWQVIVYAGLDPLTGKQRQITRQVNGSRRQAEQVEARLRTQVADGQHAGTRLKTLGELVDLWVEWRAGRDKPISPRTLEDYRGLIANKIKPALGGKRLHTINARVLDAFYDELRRNGNAKAGTRARARARAEAAARGDDPDKAATKAQPAAGDRRLSPNRVRDVHVILSGALGMAARWGWLPFNPALMARPARGKGRKRPVPTPKEVRELFAALQDEPDFAVLLRLSATAGLRPSEICALRWLDLDLDAMTLTIPPDGSIVTAKSLPNKYARKAPKSRHSERLLALDAATAKLLREHRARCERLAEQFDGRLTQDAYVFARTPEGATPIRPDAVSKRFTALVRRMGHGYTLYGLRHFMATQLGAVAEAGTVRERMGHGSLAVTSGYMHRVSGADRAAAAYMGDLLDERARQHAPQDDGSTTEVRASA